MFVWHKRMVPSNVDKRFDGMRAFYLNAMLRSLVFSLVGIFTPIYVYEVLFGVFGTMRDALFGLILFYVATRSVVFLFAIPISRIIEKIGFRRSVLVSAFFVIGYFAFLSLADRVWFFVYFAGVFLGINNLFYWVSRYSVMSIDGKDDSVGKQIGFLSVLERVGSMLGPVVGAFIIYRWDFGSLYFVGLIVLVFSIVPLFAMTHHVHRNGVSVKGFFRWLVDRGYSYHAVNFVARAMDDYSSGIVWPFAIWLMGIRLDTMGWVFSVLSFFSLLYRYISGLLFDRLYVKGGFEDEKMFFVGGVMQSLSWIVRLFVRSVMGILLVDGVFGLFANVYRSVSDDYMVLGGKRMSEIAFYTYRSMAYSFGILIYLLIWSVGVWIGNWVSVLFIATTVATIFGLLQYKESNVVFNDGVE